MSISTQPVSIQTPCITLTNGRRVRLDRYVSVHPRRLRLWGLAKQAIAKNQANPAAHRSIELVVCRPGRYLGTVRLIPLRETGRCCFEAEVLGTDVRVIAQYDWHNQIWRPTVVSNSLSAAV